MRRGNIGHPFWSEALQKYAREMAAMSNNRFRPYPAPFSPAFYGRFAGNYNGRNFQPCFPAPVVTNRSNSGQPQRNYVPHSKYGTNKTKTSFKRGKGGRKGSLDSVETGRAENSCNTESKPCSSSSTDTVVQVDFKEEQGSCSDSVKNESTTAVKHESSNKHANTAAEPNRLTETDGNIPVAERTPCFESAQDIGRQFNFAKETQRFLQHRGKKLGCTMEFSVMSYNILAESLVGCNMSLYTGCSSWILDWEYRKRNLLKEILHYNADVVCLQEVDVCHYDNWFLPELKKAGYAGSYMKRSGDKSDGCATFFKMSKFEMISENLVSYNKPRVPLMDRDNVGVILLLKPKQLANSGSETLLCVANTHLLFNKNRGDIKLAQLGYLFAEIDKVSCKTSSDQNHPVVLCGDFNSLPFSPLYKFVTNGFLHYGGMCRTVISGQNGHRGSNQYKHRNQRSANINNVILSEALNITNQCKFAGTRDGELRNESKVQKTCDVSSLNEVSVIRSVADTNTLNSGLDVLDLILGKDERPDSTPSNMPLSQVPSTLILSEETSSSAVSSQVPFSQTPSTSVISTQTTKSAKVKLALSHSFNFKSVYRHQFPNGEQEVTTKHSMANFTVDYIFYSSGMKHSKQKGRHGTSEQKLHLLSSLRLLTDNELDNLEGLPNMKLSSDHLILQAVFVLH